MEPKSKTLKDHIAMWRAVSLSERHLVERRTNDLAHLRALGVTYPHAMIRIFCSEDRNFHR